MKEIVDLVSSLSCFQNPTDIIPINGGITNVNVCLLYTSDAADE